MSITSESFMLSWTLIPGFKPGGLQKGYDITCNPGNHHIRVCNMCTRLREMCHTHMHTHTCTHTHMHTHTKHTFSITIFCFLRVCVYIRQNNSAFGITNMCHMGFKKSTILYSVLSGVSTRNNKTLLF